MLLRTVVVRTMDEIFIVAGIIVLRAAQTLLLHWEIKSEEQDSNHPPRQPDAGGSPRQEGN